MKYAGVNIDVDGDCIFIRDDEHTLLFFDTRTEINQFIAELIEASEKAFGPPEETFGP